MRTKLLIVVFYETAAFKKPTLLHVAAQGGDERIIRLLHQHGARWGTDNLCQTPLHYVGKNSLVGLLRCIENFIFLF
jgi:hypothetical protein